MNAYRILPHGGELLDLMVGPEQAEKLKSISRDLPSLTLSVRQLSDLELLMNGAFSPLTGFMTRADYDPVIDRMRLADGTLWPMPICLDVSESQAETLEAGQSVALRDTEGFMLAVMTLSDIWPADKQKEAQQVYGTADPDHPGVNYLFRRTGAYYIGGPVEGVQAPLHFAFRRLRHTPAEMRALYRKLGWRRIVGFHTRQPIHRAQFEMTLRAMAEARANLLLQPVVRPSSGEIDVYTRIRCYLSLAEKYPPSMMSLSLLPLSMRMAGPREALLHAIIRKNYGCTHFILGQNHASPVSEKQGAFYPPDAAKELALAHEAELGMQLVLFEEMVYSAEADKYVQLGEVSPDETVRRLSEREFHRRLRTGRSVPGWFSFPQVIKVLQKAHPQRHRQGITIFCTGLSGAGKSTIAKILFARFQEMGGRPVTLLDGDIVRRNLSSELGFSKEHRDINVRRIGFVASEITKNRGIAICAPIAPYAETRQGIREQIESYGGFVEVYVSTPLAVCEGRDRKGLYAKARAGMIQGFTGINDPYEAPQNPEVRIDTTDMTPDEAAQDVLLFLERAGYIR